MLSFSAYSELPLAASVTTLNASAYMSGASSSMSAGTLGIAAETTLSSVITTSAVGALGVAAQTTLSSTNSVTATSFGQVNLTATIAAVNATSAINNTSYTLAANVPISGSVSSSVAGVLQYDAKANITLNAATADADLTINDLTDEDAQASISLSGVSSTVTADWDTVNGIYAVNVVYLNTDFERSRTVNIVPYGNYTVYVTR